MKIRRIMGAALAAAMLLVLPACDGSEKVEPTPTGYQATGENNPNVPKNEYQEDAFVSVGGFKIYTAADAASHIGIDVSTHQGEIDWQQVRAAGVEFVMIRAGYRGYTGGGIYQDANFTANIQGALAAGLDVGVYFFSQAVSTEEAVEEAEAIVEWVLDYEITYPVVFDWEEITHDEARTDSVDPETVTQCVKAFCNTVQEAGYIPMVYFNKNQGYDIMNLEELAGYEFWLAGYSESPSFEYAFEMWQYSATGTVSGIQGNVDLNICLVDYGV